MHLRIAERQYCGIGESIVAVTEIYSGRVGLWWAECAANGAHQRAYANVASFIRESIHRDPKFIVDYACGAGNLLSILSRRFPKSLLAGLDGSSTMLNLASNRLSHLPRSCSQRISLIKTFLPAKVSLPRRADLAVFCFPNMVQFHARKATAGSQSRLSKRDRIIAQSLARSDISGNDRNLDFRTAKRALECAREISRNLRSLLVRGGICVRVEYATTRRHEWSPLELMRVCFEEGSLDADEGGMPIRPWFRVLASAYFRSRVMQDVYEQTGDERDNGGGYLITVLRAI